MYMSMCTWCTLFVGLGHIHPLDTTCTCASCYMILLFTTCTWPLWYMIRLLVGRTCWRTCSFSSNSSPTCCSAGQDLCSSSCCCSKSCCCSSSWGICWNFFVIYIFKTKQALSSHFFFFFLIANAALKWEKHRSLF